MAIMIDAVARVRQIPLEQPLAFRRQRQRTLPCRRPEADLRTALIRMSAGAYLANHAVALVCILRSFSTSDRLLAHV